MPEITSDTARTEITIAGETFRVPQPYTAGVVLNANEASALNQTYAENLRNNFASKVKAAQEAGTFEHDVLQGSLDDYANDYEFGVRTGGGRSGDPVQVEAMAIARELVRKAIAKANAQDSSKPKLSDVPASKISELAKGVLSRGDAKAEAIRDAARQRVEAAKEITDDVEIDSLGGASEEGEPSKKKAKAEPVEA